MWGSEVVVYIHLSPPWKKLHCFVYLVNRITGHPTIVLPGFACVNLPLGRAERQVSANSTNYRSTPSASILECPNFCPGRFKKEVALFIPVLLSPLILRSNNQDFLCTNMTSCKKTGYFPGHAPSWTLLISALARTDPSLSTSLIVWMLKQILEVGSLGDHETHEKKVIH